MRMVRLPSVEQRNSRPLSGIQIYLSPAQENNVYIEAKETALDYV